MESLSANYRNPQVDGRQIRELHSDGGSSSQFLTLPEHLFVAPSHASEENLHIYVIINNALIPEFSLSPERALPIMARAYAIPLKSQTKQGLIALYNYGLRSALDLNIASIDEQVPYSITDPLNGAYMRTVYDIGYRNTIDGSVWSQQPKFPGSQRHQADRESLHSYLDVAGNLSWVGARPRLVQCRRARDQQFTSFQELDCLRDKSEQPGTHIFIA